MKVLFGAGDRGRTDTVSLPLDFESSTSANSITPAYNGIIITHSVGKSQELFEKNLKYYFSFLSKIYFNFF